VSFADILCFASRVFVVVVLVVISLSTQFGNSWIHPRITLPSTPRFDVRFSNQI
jgi:hypothetical protein